MTLEKEKAGYRNLEAYKLAYRLALEIFKTTQLFPREELFGMTSQIRRSSRSIISNFVEGYRKRKYLKYFVSKLSDCDSECSETLLWLEMSKDCGYITDKVFEELEGQYTELGSLLGYMINHPEKYLPRKDAKK